MTLPEAAGLVEKHGLDEGTRTAEMLQLGTERFVVDPRRPAERLLELDSLVESIMKDSNHEISSIYPGDEHGAEGVYSALQCCGIKYFSSRPADKISADLHSQSVFNDSHYLIFTVAHSQEPKQKVVTRPCRTTLYSPTYCSIQEAYKESIALPAEDLELEHVHG